MDNTTKYTSSLSIRYNSDGFSLYVTDAQSNVILNKDTKKTNPEMHLESFRVFLEEALELNTGNNQVEFCIQSEYYALAPSGLFNLNELLNIIEFQHNALPKTEYTLQHNEFKDQNVALAFIVDTTIYEMICSKFDNIIIKHHLTNTIYEAIALQTAIQCIVRKNRIDLILAANNKLMYCNTHAYTTNEDILYHILNLQQSLSNGTENIPTVVLVENEQHGLEQVLRNYLTILDYKIK